MPEIMPKVFDFQEEEMRIYAWWEENGWFKPEVTGSDAEPFVISMPPPNVTGALHIGHVLFTTLEDLMIRYERMRGKAALWIPGTDHAGIATQLQVEKLLESEGTSRRAIGRDAFIERTWQWKETYGGTIIRQLRRLGASCDWDRERFTLDEGLSNAVQEVFIRLYEEGLIYRGLRLVNWSPGLQTAVSDVEVEGSEEQGKLYLFKYPLKDGGFIPVATTRPETILGDSAVAVHPEDERYKHLIGKHALVPMLGRAIPVISDSYVERDFGTGALKVTPAHDFKDYEIAKRHNLPLINIMNRDATINEEGGQYAGLDRFECRKRLWEDMTAADMTIEVRDHTYIVPRSQRGGEVIEPLISEQWFMNVKPLAEKAIAAVRDGDITIVPDRFEKVYFHWMENIEDWCISRQLWWGHRIPAWHGSDGSIHVGKTAPTPSAGITWTPDGDVLDTWFSSGLWPFSTLGWPEATDDLRRFYPTHVMETGYDILFFWVARMIMMGLWFTDKPPFKTVYLHGLVRDKLGRKISKTLGNVIDALALVEKYGADPLRFTLVTSATPGNDINLDEARVERNWRFVNKLWQMTSFIVQNLEGKLPFGLPDHETLDLPSRWILSRLTEISTNVQRLFENYQYGEAGRQIDDFLWGEFADWYIEISKYALYNGTDAEKEATRRVLVYVLDAGARMLHPFMPFVTEAIYEHLPHEGAAMIIARWYEPNAALRDTDAESTIETLIAIIRGIRNTREEYGVAVSQKIVGIVRAGGSEHLLRDQAYMFARLCNVHELHFLPPDAPTPDQSAAVIVGDISIYLPLADMIDITAECDRLTKERQKLDEQIAKTDEKLGNEQFVARARPDVVNRERERLEMLRASAAQVTDRLTQLCG